MAFYDQLRKIDAYFDALQAAKDVIAQAENITQPEPVDVVALKTSLRNQVIAGSGDKAAFFGTLTTEPTVTQADLELMGLKSLHAGAVIAERDRLRTAALALIS